MKKIRVIIIEDNRLQREGIKAMLKKEPDINVVAEFGDSDFVPDKISKLNSDVILLENGLPNQNSLEFVKYLKVKHNNVTVIVMYLFPFQEDTLRFIDAGVSGFIMKEATVSDFTNTIRIVASGEKVLPATMAESLFSQIMDYDVKILGTEELVQSVRMTNREREIVELVSDGLASKEIAHELNISVYTVKSHFHNILEKMSNTRVQIAVN